MDRAAIERLHEEASGHYLRGEYRASIEAWKRVVEADPTDAQALEGMRMSEMLLDAEASSPDESDASAPAPPMHGRAGAPDLRRRIDEIEARIEAGDQHGAVRAAETLAGEFPAEADVLSALARARLAAGDTDEAAEACARLLSLSPEYAEAARLLEECRQVSPAESPLGAVTVRTDPPELDLALDPDPGPDPVPAPAAPVDPAVAVLQRRVDDLLSQAKVAASHGRDEEALSLLSRLLILDDGNEDALALDEDLRRKAGAAARNVEDWLNDGVQCLEQGRFEEARQLFLQVLERSPGHAEALDFLEKADAQLALLESDGKKKQDPFTVMQNSEPIGGPAGSAEPHKHVWTPSAPADPAGAVSPREEPGPEEPLPDLDLEGSAVPEDAPRPRTGFAGAVGWSGGRLIALAAGGILVVLLGGFLGWKLLFGRAPGPAHEDASVELPKRASRAEAPGEPRPRRQPPVTAPASLADRGIRVAETLRRASTAYASADYGGAVVAYNEVLALDPDNVEARERLLEAGDLYRKRKLEAEKLEKGKAAFAAGEFESALRLFYRVPQGVVDAERLNRYKVAGWYNLGVIALRAADCPHALSQFNEAKALSPADAQVREARGLADACAAQRKDRAFYDRVEAMPFRDLGD